MLETGHGRVDVQSYGVVQVPRDWSLRQDWPSVRAVGYAKGAYVFMTLPLSSSRANQKTGEARACYTRQPWLGPACGASGCSLWLDPILTTPFQTGRVKL